MRNIKILAVFVVILCSCSTVRKTSRSSIVQNQHIDSSTNSKDYTKETTVTETAAQTVYTAADSVSIGYYLSLMDTIAKWQSVSTGALGLEVLTTPQVKDGKVTGLTVSARAKKDSEAVVALVNRSTSTTETGSERRQSSLSNTHIETEVWYLKYTKSMPACILFIASGILFYIIIRAVIKYSKKV